VMPCGKTRGLSRQKNYHFIRKTRIGMGMKKLFLALFVLIAFSGCSNRLDNEYFSYEYLKNDYDQVAVVVHVDVQEASAIDSIGDSTEGYVRYLVRGQAIEAFKGDVGNGKPLEYYSVAEKGYDPQNYRGHRVVFLKQVLDKRNEEWVFCELENSARPASKAIIRKMGRIEKQAVTK